MAREEQPEWLESFLAVVEQQGFSTAAQRVHRSQSRVSSHVAALERSIGATLFDRSQRPVKLTDAGAVYLDYAREALDALRRGAEAVAEISEDVRGVVVVGCHVSASAGFLVRIVPEIAELYPGIRIELVEDTTVHLSDRLLSGEVDIAVRNIWPPLPETSLTHQPLWREPFVAVVPPGHPLDGGEAPVDPRELNAYPLISVGHPGGNVEPEISHAADEWGVSYEWRYLTQQPQTLINMVREGLGVGLINRLALAISHTEGVVCRQVGDIADGRVVCLWWDTKRSRSAAARKVSDHILAARIPDGGEALPVLPSE